MDFLKIAKRRSFVSDVIYNVLNIALAVAILVVVLVTGSPLPAFALIFLSKWRVLAVRPRYWAANIQANLVDIIVSVSTVLLIFELNESLAAQIILTLLYTAWLLFLKPRSKRILVAVQAGVAVFVGVTALYMVAYGWPASLVVLLMWLIGYASARHMLGSYDEPHILFLSLVWGLLFAELGWVSYHFTFVFPIFDLIQIPLVAIIALAAGYMMERLYSAYHHNDGVVKMNTLILPLLLSSSVVICLLIIAYVRFFNDTLAI